MAIKYEKTKQEISLFGEKKKNYNSNIRNKIDLD